MRRMNTRYVSPPPAWGAEAAAVPASAGTGVRYLWRAVAGWLADIRARYGSPAQLAGARRYSAGLRLRLGALEALIRCLVLEAARRLAPSLPGRLAAGRSGARPEAAGRTARTQAGAVRAQVASTAPVASDPAGWQVSFAWSGVEASPPRSPPVLGGRAHAPGAAAVEPDGVWTAPGPGPAPADAADDAGPVFTGRFGPCPAPRWRYFPELSGAEAPVAAPDGPSAYPFPAFGGASGGGVPANAIRRAWALAARLEAVGRILSDPEPHVGRMARRLAAGLAGATSAAPMRRAYVRPPRPLGSSGPRVRWLRSDLRDLLHDADLAWNAFLCADIDSS